MGKCHAPLLFFFFFFLSPISIARSTDFEFTPNCIFIISKSDRLIKFGKEDLEKKKKRENLKKRIERVAEIVRKRFVLPLK